MSNALPMLSLGPLTIIRAPHRALVQAAAAGGFDATGLRLIAPRPGDPVHPLVGDPSAIRELGRQMTDAGIALLDIESCWLSPTTDPAAITPALDAAAALGGKYLLCAGNDPDWNRMADNFAAIAALAAARGLKVGIEPTSYLVVHTLAHGQELLRRSGAPNAGVIIDALHMARAGETPQTVAALDPRLIAYAQICDARAQKPEDLMAEARGDRLLPGAGALPLRALLAALPADLPLGVEAPVRAFAELEPDEVARHTGQATRAFLQGVLA